MSRKLVGGRIEEELDKTVLKFLSGKDIIFDKELVPYDILGNMAHSLMLNKIGAIPDEEIGPILTALKEIYEKWQKGDFHLSEELEDVHMNIEYAVTERLGGEIGGKMHLARSRNDQVLVDLRLFLREAIIGIQQVVLDLIETLVKRAEENIETLFISYTHLQQAQPITFAHWCMAHVDALIRDLERLFETYTRVNLNPLGAGALAGTSWAIDRTYTSTLLGFDGIQENTLDVISSRGELEAELLGNCSLIMIHIGRIAEDVILGATSEFGYIILDDAYTTGSSIMPQKKNPDVAELIRAKIGIIHGKLFTALSILKGLPSGYNRDHQDLKEALFPSLETIKLSLIVLKGLISTLKLNEQKINDAIYYNFIIATELVDLLVKESNIPFRTAYLIIGTIIKDFIKEGKKSPNDITPEILMKAAESYSEQKILISVEKIKKAIDPLETIKRRKHIGGPAPTEEKRMINDRKQRIKDYNVKIMQHKARNEKVVSELLKKINEMRGKEKYGG